MSVIIVNGKKINTEEQNAWFWWDVWEGHWVYPVGKITLEEYEQDFCCIPEKQYNERIRKHNRLQNNRTR